MYLKEIRAKGFKSFADQTVIELNNNVTGIVGPNGSGKSNVVDAVRWVLGEQSVKSLRGNSSMTDVIFSGSKSRKAAGSATVTLIFDNSDNYLNTPFSEVVVKRQLYASGESDYFLNNSNCRLKDITDLLIDTGIGRESFNIIGQGAIDQIIATKADERRIIFEEAAGVLKYKKRKEKALNQLAKTHLNLNRVNDVIEELEVNLEPLKEQANAALEYNTYKANLRYLEIALTAYDIHSINDEYNASKQIITDLSTKVSSIDTSFLTDETGLLTDKNKLAILSEQWHKLNQSLIVKTSDLEKIRAEKQMIIERCKYQKNNKELDHALALKEQLFKQQNTLEHYKLDLKNLLLELEQLNKQSSSKEHEVLNQKVNQLKQTIYQIEQNLFALNQKKNNLENNLNEGHNLPNSVKQVLRNNKLEGIHNCCAKLLHTKEEYANVINTSLGASSNFIIVDDDQAAKKAVNYLRINELGKATFLPLSVIKPKTINEGDLSEIVKEPGFVDIALNLVVFEPKYYPIYANLLGNTIVAKTLDDANYLSNLLDKRYRVVTIDGDQVNIGGSITGGKFKVTSGIINDIFELEKVVREIEDIENKKITITNELQDFENELIKLSVNHSKHQEQSIKISHLINHKQELISELNDKLISTGNELKTLNAIVDNNLLTVEDDLIKAYYALEQEVLIIKQDLSAINLKIEDLTNTINESEHKIKEQNTTFNQYQKELKEAEINANRLEVKLDYLLNYLNEEYSITFEKAYAEYELDTNPSDARIKVNKIKHQIKKLGDVNTGAIEEYKRISEKHAFLTEQKTDLLNAEVTILDIINEMDQVMSENFSKTFNQINLEFGKVFKTLFGGGTAALILTDPNDMLNTGVEIEALPPGKKLMHISLLSGGEKTLTAIALLFAILNSKPVPFCILDEVEAALDEANVIRFCEYLNTYANKTQFLVITHKKQTMEYVNNLYGITMQEAGVSKLVSVKLSD